MKAGFVSFIGRPNTGKSTLMNRLVGTKLARTSSTPGRTRAINFFELRVAGKPRPELIFADLPGYGYAKISREISAQWPSFIDPYLKQRPTLALCLTLVDSNIAPREVLALVPKTIKAAGRRWWGRLRGIPDWHKVGVSPVWDPPKRNEAACR